MFRSTLVAGALVMLLSACGQEPAETPKRPANVPGKEQADTTAIEREIDSRLEEGAPLRVRVGCPSDIRWKAGKTFDCVVKAADGSRSRATVTLGTDAGARSGEAGGRSGLGRTDKGEFSWRLN